MMPDPDSHALTKRFVSHHLPDFKSALQTISIAPGRGSISTSEAFWLYVLLRELRPSTIVDSGSANGWTSFVLASASPQSRIHCFDPFRKPDDLPATAVFHSQDWTQAGDWPSDTIALFDDHVNHSHRLRQARARRVGEVVFHDVYRTLDRSLASLQFHSLFGRASKVRPFDPIWDADPVFTDRSINRQMYRWLTWVTVDLQRGPTSRLRTMRIRHQQRNPAADGRARANWGPA